MTVLEKGHIDLMLIKRIDSGMNRPRKKSLQSGPLLRFQALNFFTASVSMSESLDDRFLFF